MASHDTTGRDAAGRSLTDYPRPSVAVDTALLSVPPGSDTLHVLLVRRSGAHEHGQWALPGTFLHDGERLAGAVLRSLREKAGVAGLNPRQLHVFDDPGRDDRGWVLSVAHRDAVAWARLEVTVKGRDDVRMAPVDDATGLPFDHDAIVAMAVAELRTSYRLGPDPDGLLSDPFTLLQLRNLHEAVLGRPLLKDTFRRRMQPLVKSIGKLREGEVGKPALLFEHVQADE